MRANGGDIISDERKSGSSVSIPCLCICFVLVCSDEWLILVAFGLLNRPWLRQHMSCHNLLWTGSPLLTYAAHCNGMHKKPALARIASEMFYLLPPLIDADVYVMHSCARVFFLLSKQLQNTCIMDKSGCAMQMHVWMVKCTSRYECKHIWFVVRECKLTHQFWNCSNVLFYFSIRLCKSSNIYLK